MADVVKYGIQIPNRVFVGGVAFDTQENELKEFFKRYGKVKECKIVKDSENISRGFGFVTFETKQEALTTQQLGTVFFNQKKLNLGPAIRQKGVVFNGISEAANEPVLSTGVYIHPRGYCYTVAPNGVWYFHNDGKPGAEVPQSLQRITSPASSESPAPTPSPQSHKAVSPPVVTSPNITQGSPNIVQGSSKIAQSPGLSQSSPSIVQGQSSQQHVPLSPKQQSHVQPLASPSTYPGGNPSHLQGRNGYTHQLDQQYIANFQNLAISNCPRVEGGPNTNNMNMYPQVMSRVPASEAHMCPPLAEVLIPYYPTQSPYYPVNGIVNGSMPINASAQPPLLQPINGPSGHYHYPYAMPVQKTEYYAVMQPAPTMEPLKDSRAYNLPPTPELTPNRGYYKRILTKPPPPYSVGPVYCNPNNIPSDQGAVSVSPGASIASS